MTNAGLDQALDFLSGVRPAQEQTRSLVAAWAVKLQSFDDDVVMAALFALADTPAKELPRIDVGDVIAAARPIANRRHLAAQAEQRERQLEATGASDPRRGWHQLDAVGQRQRVAALPEPHNPYGSWATCESCPATLLGFDPAPKCRNCDPQGYRRRRGKAVA